MRSETRPDMACYRDLRGEVHFSANAGEVPR
jgi:hypothetical protein